MRTINKEHKINCAINSQEVADEFALMDCTCCCEVEDCEDFKVDNGVFCRFHSDNLPI